MPLLAHGPHAAGPGKRPAAATASQILCLGHTADVPSERVLLHDFRMFADVGTAPGCITSAALERALMTYANDKVGQPAWLPSFCSALGS